jgi:hypothetical protein
MEAFNEFLYTDKINIQNITKDSYLKFKFIDNLIAEWQNPNDSKKLI